MAKGLIATLESLEENVAEENPEINKAFYDEMIEISEEQFKIQSLVRDMEKAGDALSSMESLQDVLLSMEDITLTEDHQKLYTITMESIYQSVGMEYFNDYPTSVSVSLEENRNVFRRIWEMIKKAFRKLIDWFRKVTQSQDKAIDKLDEKAKQVLSGAIHTYNSLDDFLKDKAGSDTNKYLNELFEKIGREKESIPEINKYLADEIGKSYGVFKDVELILKAFYDNVYDRLRVVYNGDKNHITIGEIDQFTDSIVNYWGEVAKDINSKLSPYMPNKGPNGGLVSDHLPGHQQFKIDITPRQPGTSKPIFFLNIENVQKYPSHTPNSDFFCNDEKEVKAMAENIKAGKKNLEMYNGLIEDLEGNVKKIMGLIDQLEKKIEKQNQANAVGTNSLNKMVNVVKTYVTENFQTYTVFISKVLNYFVKMLGVTLDFAFVVK